MAILALLAAASMFIAPEPLSDPQKWLTPDDYPSSALRFEREGIVFFSLTVSLEGQPTGCEVTRSGGRQALDDAVCAFAMKRAKFRPAQDDAATPIVSVWRSAVAFMIPSSKEYRKFPSMADVVVGVAALPTGVSSPAKMEIAVLLSAGGQIEACQAMAPGFPAALTKAACSQATSLPALKPPVDVEGKAMRSVQNATVVFIVTGKKG